MSGDRFDVHIEHVIVHGPLRMSRADHAAAVTAAIERQLAAGGVEALSTDGIDTSPASTRPTDRGAQRTDRQS